MNREWDHGAKRGEIGPWEIGDKRKKMNDYTRFPSRQGVRR